MFHLDQAGESGKSLRNFYGKISFVSKIGIVIGYITIWTDKAATRTINLLLTFDVFVEEKFWVRLGLHLGESGFKEEDLKSLANSRFTDQSIVWAMYETSWQISFSVETSTSDTYFSIIDLKQVIDQHYRVG